MFTAHASPLQVINTYTEAVQTVDAKQAVGKPHTLWVEFAKFYESNNQIPEVGPTVPTQYTWDPPAHTVHMGPTVPTQYTWDPLYPHST